MNVQESGQSIPMLDIPPHALAAMLGAQIEFQKQVGTWDEKVSAFPGYTYIRWDRVLHHLDMAVQELSEAWDQVEGGWKHHKRSPRPPSREEVLMEIVDVLAFSLNAYAFSGGIPDSRYISAHFLASDARDRSFDKIFALGDGDFSALWEFLCARRAKIDPTVAVLWGYGDGSHGEPWEKNIAGHINYNREAMTAIASTHRGFLLGASRAKRIYELFPPMPGYILQEAVLLTIQLGTAVPDITAAEFYSAFMRKVAINNARQSAKY